MEKDDYFQYLRSIAIIAVIVIHSLPEANNIVIVRQFVNFCVAVFIFLSGYLTNINSNNVGGFYKKRIVRVVIPYFLWSFVYIIIDGNFEVLSIIKKLITGQACGPFYYIIVYIQFILLAPICIKFIKNSRFRYLGIITPVTVSILSILNLLKYPIPFPYNSIIFPVWFIFYYYGMQVRYYNLETKIKRNLNINIILYILCVVLSIFEGIIWNSFGDYSMAISQIKLSSILTSLCFINMVIGVKDKVKINSPILKKIGDYSFGIYLIHLIFIRIFKDIIPGYTLITILLVICCCYITIDISYKVFGSKVCRYLGFI